MIGLPLDTAEFASAKGQNSLRGRAICSALRRDTPPADFGMKTGVFSRSAVHGVVPAGHGHRQLLRAAVVCLLESPSLSICVRPYQVKRKPTYPVNSVGFRGVGKGEQRAKRKEVPRALERLHHCRFTQGGATGRLSPVAHRAAALDISIAHADSEALACPITLTMSVHHRTPTTERRKTLLRILRFRQHIISRGSR